jgi:hypothetical protein
MRQLRKLEACSFRFLIQINLRIWRTGLLRHFLHGVQIQSVGHRMVTENDSARGGQVDRGRILALRQHARNGFVGQAEIIGDILTGVRSENMTRRKSRCEIRKSPAAEDGTFLAQPDEQLSREARPDHHSWSRRSRSRMSWAAAIRFSYRAALDEAPVRACRLDQNGRPCRSNSGAR